MGSWQSLAIAAMSVLGVACCGIGAISILAGGMSDNYGESRKATRSGCIIGAFGLALLAAAFLARLL
jgi:MFS-type transporter involved in bile tolerance (Atg22 family)